MTCWGLGVATGLSVWQDCAVTAPLKALGERVRELRKLRKWSQAQLGAEAGGLNKETINRLELGGSSTTGTLVAVATALEVEPAQLFMEGDLSRQTGTGTSVTEGDIDVASSPASARALVRKDEGPMREAVRSVREALGESMAKLIDVEARLTQTRQATDRKVGGTRARSNR